MKSLFFIVSGLILLFPALAILPVSAAPTINEYQISPYGNSNPLSVTAGPDGNLWFTEYSSDAIGRITPSGTIASYALPGTSGYYVYPRAITVGSDGALWFTEYGAIGRITTSGVITEYSVPTPGAGIQGITAGPDGNLWFTEGSGDKIGSITTSGVVTEYSLPLGVNAPSSITAGPDGNLWFITGADNSEIYKITTAGVVTGYSVPTANVEAGYITAGPDGNLWFTELNTDQIGSITTSGVVTEYPVPTANATPYGITAGPDGALWFTENAANQIGRITTSGTVSEYSIPTSSSSPIGITAGPDGNIWFTEWGANKIGQLIVPAPSAPTGLTAAELTKVPALSWNSVVGATSYDIYRDGVDIGSSTTTNYTDTTATQGSHSYYVEAVNATGSSSPSNTITVNVDNTPPVVNIVSPTANSFVSGMVTITGNIVEQYPERYYIAIYNDSTGSLVHAYAVNNPTTNSISYAWDTTAVPDGQYSIILSAVDQLGNKDAASTQSIKVTVDN